MNKIEIPKKINHQVIEDLHSELKKYIEVDIKIPLKLEYRGFGVLSGMLLLLFTWMRNKRGKLIIPIDSVDREKLKEFASDYYGYVVLSTLWRHCEIVNENNESLKEVFREHTSAMHDYIDMLSDDLPNEAVLIPCFDHYSIQKGLSHWLYDKSRFTGSPSELDNSLYAILKTLRRNYVGKLNKNLASSFDSLLKIIWELLNNTDEHARKDFLNEAKLSPNTRGLYMRIQRSSKKNFIADTDHTGLKQYYYNSLPEGDQIFILEITVFDSGPGLVKRFLGKNWSEDITMQEEVNTIRKCLIKGQTSVNTQKGEGKGHGLDKVIHLLDQKRGFLTIRTGRASIFRDMIVSPYKPTEDVQEVELFDWKNFSSDSFSEMNKVEGTSITLAYPLID
jgi:hypothetical protein